MNKLLNNELTAIQNRIDDARRERDILRRPAVRKALALVPDGDSLTVFPNGREGGRDKAEVVVQCNIWNPDATYHDGLAMLAATCSAATYFVSVEQVLAETRAVRVIVRVETRFPMPKSDQRLLRSLGKIHTERSVRRSVVCAA